MLPNMVSVRFRHGAHTQTKKKHEADNSKDVNFFFICYFSDVSAPELLVFQRWNCNWSTVPYTRSNKRISHIRLLSFTPPMNVTIIYLNKKKQNQNLKRFRWMAKEVRGYSLHTHTHPMLIRSDSHIAKHTGIIRTKANFHRHFFPRRFWIPY